jgi:HD-like signal output (HDOD) protein
MTTHDLSSPALERMLEDAVRDIGIPPQPEVLARIGAELARPEVDPLRLGRILSADVSLSAGLMKLANSPFFGQRARARTVQQALTLLGMDLACRAAAGLALRGAFPRLTTLERFWDASARIAQISGWLATRLPSAGVNQGDAYSFGLFRDCGIAVMLRRYPDYAETLRLANADPESGFTEIEMRRHPASHAVVGCLLARTWWLPEPSCLAIRHHHDVPAIAAGSIALPRETAVLIALAQFAEHALQQQTGQSRTREWEKLGPLCLGILGLDAAAEQQLLAATPRPGADAA